MLELDYIVSLKDGFPAEHLAEQIGYALGGAEAYRATGSGVSEIRREYCTYSPLPENLASFRVTVTPKLATMAHVNLKT